jgi:HEAT repeat protein
VEKKKNISIRRYFLKLQMNRRKKWLKEKMIFLSVLICIFVISNKIPGDISGMNISEDEKISDSPKFIKEQIKKLGATTTISLQERNNAIRILEKIGEKAVPFLVEILDDYTGLWLTTKDGILLAPHSTPGKDAASILAKIGKAAVGPIIKKLKKGKFTERKNAAFFLGSISDDPRVFDPLISALEDENEFVRREVVMALGKLKDPRSIGALSNSLKDKKHHVRAAAAEALGLIGDSSAFEPLKAAMRDKEYEVRKSVLIALMKIRKEPEITKSLLTILESSADPNAKKDSAYILGMQKNPRAFDILIKALKDENEVDRELASYSLGMLSDPRAIEPLILAIQDEKHTVIINSTHALGELKDPRAVEPLLKLLTTYRRYSMLAKKRIKQASIRCSIVDALGKIKDKRALKPLITALGDKLGVRGYRPENSYNVRLHAAIALGELGHPNAIEPLINIFRKRNNEDEQIALTEALFKITGKQFGYHYGKWQAWWEKNKSILTKDK